MLTLCAEEDLREELTEVWWLLAEVKNPEIKRLGEEYHLALIDVASGSVEAKA